MFSVLSKLIELDGETFIEQFEAPLAYSQFCQCMFSIFLLCGRRLAAFKIFTGYLKKALYMGDSASKLPISYVLVWTREK